MDNRDWYNDGIWKCPNCDTTFKVYVLDKCEDTLFCPICGVDTYEGLIVVEENEDV